MARSTARSARPGWKRKQPPIASVIVTPAKLRSLKGPVIRLSGKRDTAKTAKPAIVEPKRKPRTSIFGRAPDVTQEELQRRGDAADALWRELVRRATQERD